MDRSSSGPAWQAFPLRAIKLSPSPYYDNATEQDREFNPMLDGEALPDGDWLVVGSTGLFAAIVDEQGRWFLAFVPIEQLNDQLSDGASWKMEQENRIFVPLTHGEPFLMAMSWDGQIVAIAYQDEEEEEGKMSCRVELYRVTDLRAGQKAATASQSFQHDIRVLKWTKTGNHRLLVGGTETLSFISGEDFQIVGSPRKLKANLGSADWSPEREDVIAVAYLGRISENVEILMDPFFVEEGSLVLEQFSTGEVLRNLPCAIRDAADEENIDEMDPEYRADRRNIIHLAWLSKDLLVGVNRRGDVGLLQVASAPASGFSPSGLPPLQIPTLESRFYAVLLESSSSSPSTRFLFVTLSLEQYVRTADLTKDLVADPSRRSGQPRARPLAPAGTDEGLPLVVPSELADKEDENLVPLKQRACGLGLMQVKTDLSRKLHEPYQARPLLVSAGVGGYVFIFALQDGSNMEAEQALLQEAPVVEAKPPPPTAAAPAPAFKFAPSVMPPSSSSKTSAETGAPSKPSAFGASSFSSSQFKFGSTSATPSAPPAATSTFSWPSSSSSSSSFKASTTSEATSVSRTEKPPSTAASKTTTTISPAATSLPSLTTSSFQPTTSFSFTADQAAKAAPKDVGKKSEFAAVPLPVSDSDEEEKSDELQSLRDEEPHDQEDAVLALKAFEKIPSSLKSARPVLSSTSTSSSTPDQVLKELLDLAEHRQHAGDGEVAGRLALIKDPHESTSRRGNIRSLKNFATELLDRAQLLEAEVGVLEDRAKITYGKQLELARKLRQIMLLVEQEEARREDDGIGKEAKPGSSKAAHAWEADFLDIFASVERETLLEDVEELAHSIGRMLARGPQKGSFLSPTSSSPFRSPPAAAALRGSGYRQRLRERHGQLSRGRYSDGTAGLKDWLGSQAEAQLRQDVNRELQVIWQEKNRLWSIVSADPEKGFLLEKSRAQRKQQNRWASPHSTSRARSRYGVDDDDMDGPESSSSSKGWCGQSILALRDSSAEDTELLSSGAGSQNLGVARRVADLLGRVREELVGGEDVELQLLERKETEKGADQTLEELKKKRELRIQGNKKKVAEVRAAVTTTASPTAPVVASQQTAKPTPAVLPTVSKPVVSTTTTTSTNGPATSAFPGFGLNSKTTSAGATFPPQATTAVKKEAPVAKPASSGDGGAYPPMPTKAPSVFKPSEVTSKGTAASSTPTGISRQASVVVGGTTGTSSTKSSTTQKDAVTNVGGGGNAAFPPMALKAPKPFMPSAPTAGSTTAPVSSSTSKSVAQVPAKPATPPSSFSGLGSSSMAAPTTSKPVSAAAIPPMPSKAPSSFSFGGLSLADGGRGGDSKPATSVPTIQQTVKSTFSLSSTADSSSAKAVSGVPATNAAAPSKPSSTMPTPTATSSAAPTFSWSGSANASSVSVPASGASASTTGTGGLFTTPVKPPASSATEPATAGAQGGLGQMSLAPFTSQTPLTASPVTGFSLGGAAAKHVAAVPASTPASSSPFGQVPASTAGGFGVGFGSQSQQTSTFGGQMTSAAVLTPEDRMRKFYEKYEPSKIGQAAALWNKYKSQPAGMWTKMFEKYKVPEEERRSYFPEYGQQPMTAANLASQQSPLSTTTSAQFGRAGSGLGTGLTGFGTPPSANKPSGFSSFAARPSPFGSGGGSATGFGQQQQQQQASPFGFGATPSQAGVTSAFGQTPQVTPTGFGAVPFGQGSAAPTGFGSGTQNNNPSPFGGGQQQPWGSR